MPMPTPSAMSTPASPASTSSAGKQTKDGVTKKGFYLAFVKNAFSERLQGNYDDYNELVSQFKPLSSNASSSTPEVAVSAAFPTAPAHQLRAWLDALSHVVSQLDRSHSLLVEAILQLPWATMDEGFVKTYIGFLEMLVSARQEWVQAVLQRAVKGLSYRSDWRALSYAGIRPSAPPARTSTEQPDASTPTRRLIYFRIHFLLQSLLALIPTLPSALAPLLVRHFPHKRDSRVVQMCYIRNALRIAEYCEELTESILGTVIDRAIQVDVEIQVELDELEDVGDIDLTDIDTMDPFDQVADDETGSELGAGDGDEDDGEGDLANISSDEGSDDEMEEGGGAQSKAVEHIRDMVAKLDAIMKVVFDHLHKLNARYTSAMRSGSGLEDSPLLSHPSSASASPELMLASHQRTQLFSILVNIFNRTILPTFKSRYVQFLLFWYSSLSPAFADTFLGVLLQKALYPPQKLGERDEPAVIRVAAASYIASYVSRAKYVTGKSVRLVVQNLCQFLEIRLSDLEQIRAQLLQARNHGSSTLMQTYIDSHAYTTTNDPTVFYAVAQAVFYIFCFRWKDLQVGPHDTDDVEEGTDTGFPFGVPETESGAVDEGSWTGAGGTKWIKPLSVVQRSITSPLNPLKYCSSNVVAQFARVAQRTSFVYCHSIIEANRRASSYFNFSQSSAPTTPAGGPGGARGLPSRSTSLPALDSTASSLFSLALPPNVHAQADLNGFFPFDPYKLNSSSAYVDGLYRHWSEVEDSFDTDDDESSSASEEEEADESSEEEESDDDDAGAAITIPGADRGASDGHDGVLGQSFEAMSISPFRPGLA